MISTPASKSRFAVVALNECGAYPSQLLAAALGKLPDRIGDGLVAASLGHANNPSSFSGWAGRRNSAAGDTSTV